jgi:hypothetical protein
VYVEFPLQVGPCGIAYGIPETEQEICPFPDPRYVINEFQAGEIDNKVTQWKAKVINTG